jgi:hypothetical protein
MRDDPGGPDHPHDGRVMTGALAGVRLGGMTTDGPITALELREFRLNAADAGGEAARLVDSFSRGIEPAVPLLVSVDDRRDVAIVRAWHASERTETDRSKRLSLDPLVASWQDVKRYGPRITERADGAEGSPSYYRLAVTESGINDADDENASTVPQFADDATSTPIGLLWIGVPVGSGAGLLVLLGNGDAKQPNGPDARDWPLSLSRGLGVRIYESWR